MTTYGTCPVCKTGVLYEPRQRTCSVSCRNKKYRAAKRKREAALLALARQALAAR